MCVIVIKPPTVGLTKDDIERMWEKNPDGAGLCWTQKDAQGKNKLQVRKGIMDVLELQSVVAEHIEQHLFLHFRLGTHGEVSPELTHPFGLVRDIEKSKRCEADSMFFHNGILGGYGSNVKGSTISDSLDFCANVLAALPTNRERLRLLDAVAGKYLIVSPAGDYGTYWVSGPFVTVRGLSCSNDYWDTKWIATNDHGKWKGTSGTASTYDRGYTPYYNQRDLPYDDVEDDCCGSTKVFGFNQKKKLHKKKRLKSVLVNDNDVPSYDAKIAELMDERDDIQDAIDIAIKGETDTEH